MMVISNSELTIPTTAYANSGGTGDRTASITVTQTVFTVSVLGTASNLVDGSFTASTAGSLSQSGGTINLTDGMYLQFAFGSKKYIDEVKLYVDRALSTPWGSWKFQVSNDGSSFSDLNTFTWDSQTETATVTGMDAEGYSYLRITKSGATGSATNPWFEEVEFKIAAGAV